MHRRFAAQHAAGGWRGSADSFGTGAAILLGDLLLGWTGELLRASGLPAAALRRGQPVLDAMRTEMIAGQYLDLLGQAAGTGTVASALRVVRYKSAKYTVERPAPARRGAGPAQPGRRAGWRPPAAHTESRSAWRSSSATTYSGYSAIRPRPASRSPTICARGNGPCWWPCAADRADTVQASTLNRHLGDPQLGEAAAAQVRGVLTDTGALAECERMIRGSVREALAALADAPFTDGAKAALAELAATAVDRAD